MRRLRPFVVQIFLVLILVLHNFAAIRLVSLNTGKEREKNLIVRSKVQVWSLKFGSMDGCLWMLSNQDSSIKYFLENIKYAWNFYFQQFDLFHLWYWPTSLSETFSFPCDVLTTWQNIIFHPPGTGKITRRNCNRLRKVTEEYHCRYLNELGMDIHLALHFNSRLEKFFFWNVFDDFKLLCGYNKLKTKYMLSQIYLGVHAMEEETVAM